MEEDDVAEEEVEDDDVEDDDDVKGEEEDDVENDDIEEEEDDTEDADAEEDHRSQDRAACFARACAVEMHLDISQELLCEPKIHLRVKKFSYRLIQTPARLPQLYLRSNLAPRRQSGKTTIFKHLLKELLKGKSSTFRPLLQYDLRFSAAKQQSKHTSTASTKKRKSHLEPAVTLRARANRTGIDGKVATPAPVAQASQLFSTTEPLFTQKNTLFRANPNIQITSMMYSSSNAICQQCLATHNQNRNFSALLFSTLIFSSRLYSSLPLPLFYFYFYSTSASTSTPTLLLLYSALLYSALLYSALLYSALLFPLFSTLLFPTLRCSTLLFSTLLFYTLLCSAPFSTLLYAALLYSSLLYVSIRYSALLYTLLYSTLLYSVLLSSALLYSTLLYLYSTLLYLYPTATLPLLYLYSTSTLPLLYFTQGPTGHNDLWASESVTYIMIS